MNCETCVFYDFDEEYQEYFCAAEIDEDEYARLMQNGKKNCPFWRDGDEYKLVRHQN